QLPPPSLFSPLSLHALFRSHFVGVIGAVKADENFADHRLLVFGEELGNLFVRDHPVVIHLRAQRIVERETNRLFLLLLEALVERDRKSTRLNSSHVAISYAV